MNSWVVVKNVFRQAALALRSTSNLCQIFIKSLEVTWHIMFMRTGCTYMHSDNSNTWCLQPLLSLVHRHRKLLQTLHFCNFSFRLGAGGEKKLSFQGIRHCELNDYYLTDKSSIFQATRAEKTHVLKCRLAEPLVRHKILFLYVCLSEGSVFSHVEPVGQVHTVQTRCDLITSNRSHFVS